MTAERGTEGRREGGKGKGKGGHGGRREGGKVKEVIQGEGEEGGNQGEGWVTCLSLSLPGRISRHWLV